MSTTEPTDPILDWFLSQRASAEKQPLTSSERDALLELYGVSRDTWDAIPKARPTA